MNRILILIALALLIISCGNKKDTLQLIRQAEDLRTEAQAHMESRDYGASDSLARKALEMEEGLENKSGMAESLYLIARTAALSGDFERALTYGERGSEMCKEIVDYPLEYKTNNTLSWAYFTLGTDFEKILKHEERQIFVVDQMDDDDAKAFAYSNYGYDVTVAGTKHLDEILKYSDFANTYYAQKEDHQGRWYTLMNLTWQYRLKGDQERSEHYGNLAVKQGKADNDRHAIVEVNTNLGETLIIQNKLEQARPLYEEGLEWAIKLEDRDRYVFDVYHAKYLWMTGKKQEAISLLENAIQFLETSEVFYEMMGRALLGKYSLELGALDIARQQVQEFKNPRNDYISLESRTMMAITEAHLLSLNNKDQAVQLLDKYLDATKNFGAKQLVNELESALNTIK